MFTSHKENLFASFMTFMQLERRDQNKSMQPYLNVECPLHSFVLQILYKQGPKKFQHINQQVEQGNSICLTASVSREL